jgi:hypothetical protein
MEYVFTTLSFHEKEFSLNTSGWFPHPFLLPMEMKILDDSSWEEYCLAPHCYFFWEPADLGEQAFCLDAIRVLGFRVQQQQASC